MEEITATTWPELLDALGGAGWPQARGPLRLHLAYRGLPCAAHELRPALARVADAPGEVEHHLVRNFRKYAYREQRPRDSIWNWLSLGQHHGLPTRLLDWTFSPYVALHFVTAPLDRYAESGVVWCVDYRAVHRALPPALAKLLDREGADVFTTELLDEAAPDLARFDQLAGEHPFVVFFEPPSLDDRIVNQAAVFSVAAGPGMDMARWLAEQPRAVRRVVVPAELKWEVRDRLDQANVTERVLFPGLDGLARWLTRYYGPRPG